MQSISTQFGINQIQVTDLVNLLYTCESQTQSFTNYYTILYVYQQFNYSLSSPLNYSIPLNLYTFAQQKSALNQSTTYLVIANNFTYSLIASYILTKNGFNIVNLSGGLDAIYSATQYFPILNTLFVSSTIN